MPAAFDVVLDGLRAVAEASRLRLLAVLARGEFSVTELTAILGQSQPRVSRHLKVLCDAGLLEKFREQHFICYRVPAEGPGGAFVRELLARIDDADPVLTADASRVAAVLDERRSAFAEAPDAVELGDVLAAELGDLGRPTLLYYGVAPASVLGVLAPKTRKSVGMHPSRVEVQRARAALHTRGLNHCVLQQGQLTPLPHPSSTFGAAILDRVLARHDEPAVALREAARVLGAGAPLLVVEDYEALAARDPSSHPIAGLRAWFAQAGLVCRRVHPVDLDGRHLLLAAATVEHPAAAAA